MASRQNPGYSDPKGVLIYAFGGPSVGGILAVGTTVPADATTGYAAGCIFIDRDAAAGSQVWINEGTVSSSLFKAVSSSSTGAFTNGSFTNIALSNLMTLANNANIAFNATTGSMIGTNNAQKAGFWGATPVIQPAGTGELLGLNGNAATAANATNMNTNGNVGATSYSFNDVVKAMKQAGILKS